MLFFLIKSSTSSAIFMAVSVKNAKDCDCAGQNGNVFKIDFISSTNISPVSPQPEFSLSKLTMKV